MSSVGASLVGEFVAERYLVLEQIGEGGMGHVYKARQEPIGRLVALKVLLPEVMNDDRTVGRFMNEARIISQLSHHNTVKLIDFGHLSDARLFIAMDYLDGGTLGDMLRGTRLEQGPALNIARQICKSLAEAHALGILHRDLKPDNVLLDEMHGEEIHIRVVDFGLAKVSERGVPNRHEGSAFGRIVETMPGVRLGTPIYMSPEQSFAKELDGRTDIYALGVLMYQMLTGHVPFAADNDTGMRMAHAHERPRAMDEMAPDAHVDQEAQLLVMQMLEKDPERRPGSAEAVLYQIDRLLARVAPVKTRARAVEASLRPMPVAADSEEEPIEAPQRGSGGWERYGVVFATGIAVGWLIALVLHH